MLFHYTRQKGHLGHIQICRLLLCHHQKIYLENKKYAKDDKTNIKQPKCVKYC